MSTVFGVFDVLINKPVNRELLASLLVMAVLVCHGAYGVTHQYVCETVVPQHPGEATSFCGQTPDSGGEQQTSDGGHLAYLAGFFSLLAAVLYLRPQGTAPSHAAPPKRAFRGRVPSIERYLPQPSFSTFLQVFRL